MCEHCTAASLATLTNQNSNFSKKCILHELPSEPSEVHLKVYFILLLIDVEYTTEKKQTPSTTSSIYMF